ncbi:XTP/dITP diphosphohydrolase [Desulfonispora thiosulfatigenes DSM 11270]|uniref:dITP/XTP pyrophosphatase n=1 Tax=Desulfonispora thiosulfatigenes DSM 11270 TaxID=656914 RepID=A0A1W1V883_DESTI|nr:XTP/dITP diphosphohydrolase [Desulfonispora thiosulfatigenes DSM 11270]
MKEKVLVLASNNKGKISEFERLLESLKIKVLPMSHFPEINEVEETGTTFKENALLKAREVARLSGQVSLADDSGLEVDYLKGEPGVYSARFAGEPKSDERNNEKLLEMLKGVPSEKRTARFKCCIAIVLPDGKEYTVEDSCEGYILEQLVGEGGFGYDPLFFVDSLDKTFAELNMQEKIKLVIEVRQ